MSQAGITQQIRLQLEEDIAAGRGTSAQSVLAQLWRERPNAATAAYVVSCLERLRPHLRLTSCRVAVLRSFTLEPALPFLKAAAFLSGMDVTARVSEFNAHAQEILDPASALYTDAPDVAILAVQTRDIAPRLWEEWTDLSAGEMSEQVERTAAMFQQWIEAFRSRSRAALLIHTLDAPPHPAWGVLDTQIETGQTAAIARINERLRALAAAHQSVHLLDYDGLIARRGRDNWYDERKWLMARMPIRAENLRMLAAEWLRFLHPLRGKTAKVVVTDLDNTLWGGVIGEDQMDGIRLDRDNGGAAFWNVQRALLDLHRRGILLAIASKNNPDDALRALREHPGMLLRPHHFSAMRIHWGNKASSLREIALELNVGADSLAFVDDNPAERQQVRIELPEAAVIELPSDPMEYAGVIRECPLFERLSLFEEDRERGRYYAGQQQRRAAQQSASSLEEFYHSLEQAVEIAGVTPATLPRVAQLTQKTNQFNLTTRRYTEADIARFVAQPDWKVYAVRVKDRFGDNGIVGAAIVHTTGEVCEIDSLLLSCRVIGRTVETAMLAFLISDQRRNGVKRLEGCFIPTRKNAPAEGFYLGHGFELVRKDGDGASLWALDVDKTTVACPAWIRSNAPTEPVLSAYAHF
jgi:FkbH-like protein